MVTRKPVGSLDTSGAGRKADPPYPTSPEDTAQAPASASSVYSPDLANSPAFDLIDVHEARTRPRKGSDVSSHGTWDTDDEDKEEEDYVAIPKPLRITPSKQNLSEEPVAENRKEELPAILRPGPANPSLAASNTPQNQHLAAHATANPWADEHTQHKPQVNTDTQPTNPYLKPKLTGDAPIVPSWSNVPTQPPPPPPQEPQTLPVELPTVRTPAEELSRLDLGSVTTSTGLNGPLPSQHSGASNVLSGNPQNNGHPTPAAQHEPPTPQQKWGDQVHYPPPPPGPPPSLQQLSLIDHQDPVAEPYPATVHPSLRTPSETPAHSTQHTQTSATSGGVSSAPGATSTNQRNEHYQIKHINWQDNRNAHSSTSIRQSPILTQNANGPCPLLALVNGLVLTTPPSVDTALIETLRTREQISLGLLLDAVFDELMSGRRGDSATALPDVSELYAFLLALHTGMNVNPRFVASQPQQTFFAQSLNASSTHSHNAGGFEQTREMKLYSTFNVPLIHGWLPTQGSPAAKAFERCAQSFEDAQNIQFAESELEDKLRASGLTSEEQQLLQDIQTIKHFLDTWPTQLTDRGLESISHALNPGQFAILFRNDHFSTIYKEPKHGALMTLVTDAGYSSHDEIVWESLVDVNGAASEMFSGDFRAVSHGQDARLNQQSSAGGAEGWSTVPSRNQQQSQPHQHVNTASRPSAAQDGAPPLPGPRPPTLANTVAPPTASAGTHQRSRSEQEDHDLALALQLQEEEEAQQRQTEDRRRREQQLSEQFLSTQPEGRPPTIPPRRGGSRQSTSTRPAVNRPTDEPFDPDAPPTYEQSASDRPYREAGSTARPATQSNPLNAYDALRRQQEQQQQSAYAQQSAHSPNMAAAPLHGRRQSYGRNGRRPQNAATTQEAEDKCVVM